MTRTSARVWAIRDPAVTGLSLITEALRQSFCGPRQLAEVGGFSLASAKRYWRGTSVPNVTMLMVLTRNYREIGRAVAEYAGLDEASLAAESDELRRMLIDAYAQIEGLHAECQRLLAEVEKPVATLAAAPDPGTDQPTARGIQAEGRR